MLKCNDSQAHTQTHTIQWEVMCKITASPCGSVWEIVASLIWKEQTASAGEEIQCLPQK